VEKRCKGCQKLIHILQMNDGTWKAFEDAAATIPHKCAEYVKLKSKSSDNEHVLLASTVSRVSQAERRLEQIKEVMEKNGLHFEWS